MLQGRWAAVFDEVVESPRFLKCYCSTVLGDIVSVCMVRLRLAGITLPIQLGWGEGIMTSFKEKTPISFHFPLAST